MPVSGENRNCIAHQPSPNRPKDFGGSGGVAALEPDDELWQDGRRDAERQHVERHGDEDECEGGVSPRAEGQRHALVCLNLKFATLFGSRTERTSNSKSTLESISSRVAYDSEIRSEPSIETRRISESPH
jgi:hypothetical protein